MSYHQHPYLNGTLLKESEPLFRYLPPYPEGVYSDWAAGDAGIKKGDWILDPFGASPYAALELAAQGYRVLMLSNNPVINFITEVLAESPSELDFKAALSELTKIRRGDEWLDQHLNNLYSTQCPSCNSPIAASAFLWRKGDNTPYACIYRCDKCQSEGEKPCSQTDIEQLNRIGSDKLHRARALQRVIDLNSDAQDDVLEILGHYLTRPLYFITTLINKIEGSDMPVQRQKLLYALILSICDQGNTLWGHPSGRTRPKQLLTPAVFKELNLWAVLESSIKNWSNRYSPVELCRYPAAPLSNGICLLSGRLRTLAELPDSITPAAVICTLPRPNQAFWSLSAIWSGWLWGKENVDPMKSMLERKRFDWNWLDNALALSFSHLNRLLPDGIPFFTIFSELDPGFITAGLHAAASTGLSIKAAALCEEDDLLQTWWNNNKTSKNIKNSPGLESNLRQSVISFLSQIVEPASYIRLLSHALLESCDNYSIVQKSSKSQTLSSIRLIQNNFDSILNHTSSVIGFQQEHTGI